MFHGKTSQKKADHIWNARYNFFPPFTLFCFSLNKQTFYVLGWFYVGWFVFVLCVFVFFLCLCFGFVVLLAMESTQVSFS